ncbi:hypothetical protein P4118_02435 [Pseudomonas aeruginosa]|nr:hypothetical protein [Pseudomonas aeruginosa]
MDIHEQPQRQPVASWHKLNGKATGNVSTAELQDATLPPYSPTSPLLVLRSRGHQQAVPEQYPGERRRRLDHRAVAEDRPGRGSRRRRRDLRGNRCMLAAMPARPSAPRPKPAATGSSRTSTS